MTAPFHDQFVALFDAYFPRLFRYLDRLTGDPDQAADLAQEAFVRLHTRGSLPNTPEAWLVTVAMNLFRNDKSTRSRRRRLLNVTRGEAVLADPPPSPSHLVIATDASDRVRAALDELPERDRQMLLLHAEGYKYREIAQVLELNEASVGTLLARAKRAFRDACEVKSDAP
ncbi:MAG TPA: sigma-70 family RNA polymerase sigma factor [Gemmatimonadaceae bacterium]|nr:sigma-70 family RNA polymerase sigma factor [Gemmatimonadaceae bacterium]